jgi:hypothetical protein
MIAALGLLLLQGPVPDLIVVQQDPVIISENYDLSWPSNCAGVPLGSGCNATLVGFYYPSGMGPTSLGYSNPPSAALILLRGGNGNLPEPNAYGWFAQYVLPEGFMGVDPNYPAVLPGEDYTYATDDLAYLIQYLRYYHEWLNIDPDRIVLLGRSFGGIQALALGLKEDYQDLASADPIEHESSRPDYVIDFSGMTNLSCMADESAYGEFFTLWFPVGSAPGATYEQQLADSAVWWLLHPELYGRPMNPPICLGYSGDPPAACGFIWEPHDSYFGIEMRDSIDVLAEQQGDAAFGLSSVLLETTDVYGTAEATPLALDWAQELFEPQVESLYLIPVKTPVTANGSIQDLDVIGAVPGALVGYFVGFTPGPISVPWCPAWQTGLLDFFPLGWRAADASGKATLSVFAPPSVIGLPLVLHAADFQSCSVSNLLAQTWLQ